MKDQQLRQLIDERFAEHERCMKEDIKHLVEAEQRLNKLFHEFGKYLTVGGEVKDGALSHGISDRLSTIEDGLGRLKQGLNL